MKKTMLIVEDDKDIQDYYSIIFSDSQIEIIRAENGQEAMSVINSSRKIDIILLDMIMPTMDGEEFFRKLRLEKKSKIPVIPCSVDDTLIKRLEQIDKIDIYFSKFTKADTLKTKVKSVLGIF
ncbi:MAG: response regulator [bacterium]